MVWRGDGRVEDYSWCEFKSRPLVPMPHMSGRRLGNRGKSQTRMKDRIRRTYKSRSASSKEVGTPKAGAKEELGDPTSAMGYISGRPVPM